jgi:hypothetical protein
VKRTEPEVVSPGNRSEDEGAGAGLIVGWKV